METNDDVYLKIQKLEEEGNFFEYVDKINYRNIELVKDDYEYIKKGVLNDIIEMLARSLISVIGFYNNHIISKINVLGRENLDGIESAIVTCNHISKNDFMMVREAVWGHRLYVAIEERDNRKDWYGKVLRRSGMIPVSSKENIRPKFDEAIKNALNDLSYVLFYPEGAMWPNYTKPRPYQNGAFYYAVKNDVPIIPIFTSIIGTGKYDKAGNEKVIMTLNILKPIYPVRGIGKKEAINKMKEEHFVLSKKKYEEMYKTRLEYITKQKI